MIFPTQRIKKSKKDDKWKKSHLDWAVQAITSSWDSYQEFQKRLTVNYDLYSNILHKEDIEHTLASSQLMMDDTFSHVDDIEHYPVINKYFYVLLGEMHDMGIPFHAVTTNPDAVSQREKDKIQAYYDKLMSTISNMDVQDEEAMDALKQDLDYIEYDWQDLREIRANCVLTHYENEQDFLSVFNNGYLDGLIASEEHYLASIVGGEPLLERIDPRTLTLYRSSSNKSDDADVAIITEYWSPSKIVDTYYDVLTKEQLDKIEEMSSNAASFGENSISGQSYFTLKYSSSHEYANNSIASPKPNDTVDEFGNIRVIRMFWKSFDTIKRVKHIDTSTGRFTYDFFSEDYVIDKNAGEEEELFWINRAWEGTLIAGDIYINIQPRPFQLNSLSNPSKCSLGIVGQKFTQNGFDKPTSIMDIVKPYIYMYDVVHDKLNKAIARDLGSAVVADFAQMPLDWGMDKWVYMLKQGGLYCVDSSRETPSGVAVGMMTNRQQNYINQQSASITQYINILNTISEEISECVGISRQRLGDVGKREAATTAEQAQSASFNITQWLVAQHLSVMKRALELFVNVTKTCLRGHSKKFDYILPDSSKRMIEIDGDLFGDNDYGCVMDDEARSAMTNSQIYELAHAGVQTGSMKMSTIFKILNTKSIAQRMRILENDERILEEKQKAAQEAEAQAQQEQNQMLLQQEERKMQHELQKQQNEIDAKIRIAEINAKAEHERFIMGDFGNIRKDNTEKEIADKQLQFQEKKLAADTKVKEELIRLEKNKTKEQTTNKK